VRSVALEELPPPPPGRLGWPWTVGAPLGRGEAAPDDVAWPRVTIVTPTLNQVEFIEETIRSVLLQGYPDLEYIVMDGGSTDGTARIIRRYEPWLAAWQSGPDGGQTQAINTAWEGSTGDVLAWINSDDAYLPGALHRAVAALREEPSAGMAYGSAIVVDADGHELRRWAAKPFTLEAMLLEGNVVPQPAAFFARNALRDLGFLDERWTMIMDYALSIRLGLAFPAIPMPELLARFRDHPTSRSRSRHKLMASELLQLIDQLPELRRRPDMKRRARARIHFESAHASLVGPERDDASRGADAAVRQLRRSLRADASFAVRRPLHTAYLAKEIVGRRIRRS
jgi:hypothetical protein